MVQVLNDWSEAVRKLFEQAWHSATLVDCPHVNEWFEAIDQLTDQLATADATRSTEPFIKSDPIFALFDDRPQEPPRKPWWNVSPLNAIDPLSDMRSFFLKIPDEDTVPTDE